MKSIELYFIRCIFLFSAFAFSTSCSFLNIFSPSPYQSKYDSNGNIVLRDTKGKREGFIWAINIHIKNEVANNRVPGTKNSHDWKLFWTKTIKVIEKGSENPQWYVNYIVEARRASGLPELKY